MVIEHEGLGGAVLSVRGASFVREGRFVLSATNLEVRRGQRWALIGPNGAGKSTLINLMAAVNHPSSGSVSVLGYTLGKVDMRELRQHIGLVTAPHSLLADLTARQVVLTGATGTIELLPRWDASPAILASASTLLAQVGLSNPDALRWRTMSQGERGRALIARSLMNDPALLLLDEAAAGLDVAAREQLLQTLSSLSDSHPRMATVTVTHHFEELPVNTTHAALMREGHIVEQGPVGDVLTSENVSKCFDHPIVIGRSNGRWSARSG